MAYAPYLREPTVCKNCGAVIGFVKNRNGRWFPVDFVYNPSDPDGECDVQVCFRTPEDVAAAKETAAAILREAGLARFRFGEYASPPEDCANLYNIPAAILLPNRVFPNAPSLPNAPSRQNPSFR